MIIKKITNGTEVKFVEAGIPQGWLVSGEAEIPDNMKKYVSDIVDGQALFNDTLYQSDKLEKSKSTLEQAVDRHLNDMANQHEYDSILSACSYAGEVNPFQAESKQFIAWRGSVWAHVIQVQADVLAGLRTVPTEEELIAELPVLNLV